MSDTPSSNDPGNPEHLTGDRTVPTGLNRPAKGRRRRRIALASIAAVLVLVGGLVAGGYAAVNHLAGSIRRVPVSFAKLDAANRHAGGPTGQSMTVLLTGEDSAGVGGRSGLIMLLHINADQAGGGVVSIPPNAIVQVPGHGETQVWNSLADGGPNLLVQTVEQLTNVQIDHYARIDFAHVASVVDAIGGVNVTLPEETTSFGHTFFAGSNHLNGTAALDYARQPSLTEQGRVLRQQSLIRAILRKIANENLLTSPVTGFNVLSALTAALTVDSDFTNGELESLATELGGLGSSAGTFVTAPSHLVGTEVFLNAGGSHQLWTAIMQDSIAAFAASHPGTVTPSAPR